MNSLLNSHQLILTTHFQQFSCVSCSNIAFQLHEGKGTKFIAKNSPKEFVGEDGKLKEVVLQDGTTLPADLCIMGIGKCIVNSREFVHGKEHNDLSYCYSWPNSPSLQAFIPRLVFWKTPGLRWMIAASLLWTRWVDPELFHFYFVSFFGISRTFHAFHGILLLLCFQHMRTNKENVFAAGDIVTFPLFMSDDEQANVQHWQMAHRHGKSLSLRSTELFWAQDEDCWKVRASD